MMQNKPKKQKPKKNKELQLNPNIAKHDAETKLNHAKEWIDKGHRIKIIMVFRGRMIMHKEVGMVTFDAMVKSLIEHGAVVGSPKKEDGGTVTIILDSKTKKPA
jgi:translation initiation factor IF-3